MTCEGKEKSFNKNIYLSKRISLTASDFNNLQDFVAIWKILLIAI
tara:strand:- start:310 stop:444 length:135 start_codon:yes stop_codon:yes gene_type:complete